MMYKFALVHIVYSDILVLINPNTADSLSGLLAVMFPSSDTATTASSQAMLGRRPVTLKDVTFDVLVTIITTIPSSTVCTVRTMIS